MTASQLRAIRRSRPLQDFEARNSRCPCCVSSLRSSFLWQRNAAKGEAKQIRVVAVVSHVGSHFFNPSRIDQAKSTRAWIALESSPLRGVQSNLAPRLTDSNHCRTPTQTILCYSLLTPTASSEVRQRAWISSLGFLPGAAFPTRERTPHESEQLILDDARIVLSWIKGGAQWFRDKVQVGPAFSLAEESRRMR